MMRLTTSAAALALALSFAGPAAAKKAAATAPKCPVCKMTLASKKSKATPVAMKIGNKTYYCCDKCNMSKKGNAKAKSSAS
jgi:C4-type Zn-finger protein